MISEKKLAIVCTHPIQYYVPLFQQLASKVCLMVFYSERENNNSKYDPGFRKKIKWDIPMLNGYPHAFPGRDIIAQLEIFNPDKILIYGWPFHRHLKIIRYFKGKIWFRGDSIVPEQESRLKTTFKSLLLKWVYGHVDKVFYVGTQNKFYFQKYGLREEQLIFAPHAVDNARFGHINRQQSLAIRRQLRVPEEDILILFAGKFNRNKNPGILLSAFCNLDLSHVHLLFVGDGDLKQKLKQDIRGLPRVHILPFQNQTAMPAIYQASDLFCLTSIKETWGLSVNEAMAAGKAILIADSVGCATDLVGPENGRVFNCNSLADLQKKLCELTIDKARLLKYGQRSKSIIQDWSVAQQVQTLLRELD